MSNCPSEVHHISGWRGWAVASVRGDDAGAACLLQHPVNFREEVGTLLLGDKCSLEHGT